MNRTRWHLDAFDSSVLAAFLLLSVLTVWTLMAKQSPQQLWTGTNGPYIGDQMQYLGWIRDSARHVLIGNPFRTTQSPNDYLHPGLAISGLLVRLGVSAWLSYLLWVPVAALALFAAARVYVRRLITGTAKRRCALTLCLFYISPMAELAARFHWSQLLLMQSLGLTMWPVSYLWGYPFTAVTVALMLIAFITYERDRNDGRVRPWAPACALFCAWLQPWQGAIVILVVVASEALLWLRQRQTPPLILASTTVGAGIIPLGYYFLLSHLDSSWALSGRVNFAQVLPSTDILLSVVPLGAGAVLAYSRSPGTFQDVAIRVWPFAAYGLLRFIQLAHVGTFPKDSLQGLSIPLAVLAVIGVSRLPLGLPSVAKVALGSVVVCALLGPPVLREVNAARALGVPTVFGPEPYLINPSESDALRFLNTAAGPGAVLSSVYLGQTVPAETGRRTWVGILSWTPNYNKRVVLAQELFSGNLTAPASVNLVLSSRVRLLLADCTSQANLSVLLEPIVQSVHRFGCAAVYTIRTDN